MVHDRAGGEFQYNLSMIDAVAALPPDQYSVRAIYTSKMWVKHLAACNLPSRFVPNGFWSRASSLLWTRIGLPLGLWRMMSPKLFSLASALLHEKCDLWIFPHPTARSFQIPVASLVSIHDLMHRYERRFPESASRWEYYNREINLPNICKWSQGVLVDSEVGRQHVAESYNLAINRIHVLPYIPPRYVLKAETPPDFDARYNLPAKFIFYPAQFWEHKNHKKLIEAVSILKSELPDLKLVLTGSPKNAYEKVVEMIRGLKLTDDVVILGYVPDDDMPEFYRRARALVMPTYYGPTNIPPLEAFSLGCPVAISSVYAMPEQAGGAALLFDPESVEEIADCIKRLWVDDALCTLLAEQGKRRAQSWGQKQFNERLHSIVEQVIQ